MDQNFANRTTQKPIKKGPSRIPVDEKTMANPVRDGIKCWHIHTNHKNEIFTIATGWGFCPFATNLVICHSQNMNTPFMGCKSTKVHQCFKVFHSEPLKVVANRKVSRGTLRHHWPAWIQRASYGPTSCRRCSDVPTWDNQGFFRWRSSLN